MNDEICVVLKIIVSLTIGITPLKTERYLHKIHNNLLQCDFSIFYKNNKHITS